MTKSLFCLLQRKIERYAVHYFPIAVYFKNDFRNLVLIIRISFMTSTCESNVNTYYDEINNSYIRGILDT